MGLLSRLGRAVRAGVMRFSTRSSEGWSYLTGRSRRDARLVGDGSSNSIVVAAVGWIGRNFPSAPIRVQVRDSKGALEVATDDGSRAFLELLETPNAFYDGSALLTAMVVDYWIDGNGYVVKVRDRTTGGRVVALWWIPSFLIEPKWPDDGSVFLSHYLYVPSPEVEIRLEVDDVIHVRNGFDPANIRKGRSPLKSVLREIYTDEEAASYTSTMLRNLGVPGVIISPGDSDIELEDADADAIKAQFDAEFTADRRGRPMVLGANAKVDRISFSPTEMNLRELRQIPEERITGVLGIAAIVAGMGAGLARSTFANFAEAREASYEENVVGTQDTFARTLRRSLLPEFVAAPEDHVVDFDLSKVRVLQEDENKKWERGVNAVKGGAILISDFNRMVGLPVDEKIHDVYLRSSLIVAVRKDSPEATGEEVEEPEPDQGPPPEGLIPPGTVPLVPAVGAGNGNGNGAGGQRPAPANV